MTQPEAISQQSDEGAEPHRTDSGHHGVDVPGVPAVVRQPLAEEEVEFAVVGVRAVGDQVGVDEGRLWKRQEGQEGCSGEGVGPEWARVFTAQPLGVVLVRPDGVPPGQAPEDGGVRPHEVDVHAGKQLLIWGRQRAGSARARRRSASTLA